MTRTETKGERKRTTTTKQNTSNSSYLVEEVTPQILSLGTKHFAVFKNVYNIRAKFSCHSRGTSKTSWASGLKSTCSVAF